MSARTSFLHELFSMKTGTSLIMLLRNWGVILLAGSVLIYELNSHGRVDAEDGFVGTRGVQFTLNGSPFYANGFNAYWMMYLASDPSTRHKVTSTYREAAQHGLVIARTWAFADGGYSPLQYSPGSYNERMFQGLDFVVSEAGKYGIKLILSLVNNYPDLGGKEQYVKWAREHGQNIQTDDEFFTNSVVKGYYKDHIKAVLTRRNTFTGVAYMDDPTIMAWELMNEPRCPTDLSGKTFQAWISEMAAYLKSIDKKHLLEVGLEGFYGPPDAHRQQNVTFFQVGTDFIANNQVADIDFATVHSYPAQWFSKESKDDQLSFLKKWLINHIEDAENVLSKPVVFAEFGKSSKDSGYSTNERDEMFDLVYSTIYDSASRGGAAGGGMFWQILAEEMDVFRDGYEVLFGESPSTAKVIAEQAERLHKITKL